MRDPASYFVGGEGKFPQLFLHLLKIFFAFRWTAVLIVLRRLTKIRRPVICPSVLGAIGATGVSAEAPIADKLAACPGLAIAALQ